MLGKSYMGYQGLCDPMTGAHVSKECAQIVIRGTQEIGAENGSERIRRHMIDFLIVSHSK